MLLVKLRLYIVKLMVDKDSKDLNFFEVKTGDRTEPRHQLETEVFLMLGQWLFALLLSVPVTCNTSYKRKT